MAKHSAIVETRSISQFTMKVGITIPGLLFMLLSFSCQDTGPELPATPPPFKTPLGKVISRESASGKPLQQYLDARKAHEKDSTDVDLLIWYGRRMAYLGNYEDAIEIYTNGLRRFPDEARLYRHRGHRYISIREFDKAIADLEKASELIEGTTNETEPDGIPNAMNIPVSTLHGNIWYHLGLAHYLKGNYEEAYTAYLNCLRSSSNHDNLVSSTHWLYMIQRRQGNHVAADSLLLPITRELEIIENHSYHNLCLFYKGSIPEKTLLPDEGSSAASDAISYGLANWYLMEGKVDKGYELLNEMVEGENWTSFGYIAAESDLIRLNSSAQTATK
ncbi:Tetratricopeptide repeat-containing protein [Muriicola jejuensis]|uniref:Tetratricopeptide repeat protein n=1 Tax=Muriicola jejuensis TaxID=504488 RepID=A0A6P0U9U0_9FLAO|nr:tetratricopeptide repeat protein [Muriicola jejuensis]NER09322.1 tetratricopeptide repeat protein [Muriicola jejuensis]SMP09411.1 Tetratricopeptide repeat-containing protein [Muriicola jejuensis]